MKHNQLITTAQRIEYLNAEGYSFPEHRNSGRSTALALSLLGEAMKNPGCLVRVRDHIGSTIAHEMLLHTMIGIAQTLELRFLSFSKADLTVSYDVYKTIGVEP